MFLTAVAMERGVEDGLNSFGLQNGGAKTATGPACRQWEPPVASDQLEAHASNGLVEHDVFGWSEEQATRPVRIGIGKDHAPSRNGSTAADVKRDGTFVGVVGCV